jgi:hypothetical protein
MVIAIGNKDSSSTAIETNSIQLADLLQSYRVKGKTRTLFEPRDSQLKVKFHFHYSSFSNGLEYFKDKIGIQLSNMNNIEGQSILVCIGHKRFPEYGAFGY